MIEKSMYDEKVLRLEEVSLTSWPALQSLSYDGWLLRLADGFTDRCNSVWPLYASDAAKATPHDTNQTKKTRARQAVIVNPVSLRSVDKTVPAIRMRHSWHTPGEVGLSSPA